VTGPDTGPDIEHRVRPAVLRTAAQVVAAAQAQPSWAELARTVRGCVACAELAATRTQVVPGVLPRAARLLCVGEAPGAQEDIEGVPFVGRAGQLLDDLLAQAGLDRRTVAVCNVLKCRPPANRRPARAESAACRPWLLRQIELADPWLVLTLGLTAAQWALGAGVRLSAARGRVHLLDGRPMVATYHPSAALRFGPNGAPRAALLTDLVQVTALLAGVGSPGWVAMAEQTW
jgi:uracil-DNA glycosylase